MVNVSDAWKEKRQAFIAPESFIEIDCGVSEAGLQESATASGTDEAVFSQVESILGLSDTSTTAKYATLEHNLWALDGTRNILPDAGPYSNTGYVSNIAETGSVTLTLPEVHTVTIPGVTIVWSSEFGEYPPVFTVTAYSGSTIAAETTVTDNTQQKCDVQMELADYDSIKVTVHNWSLPGHRARIDQVYLGHLLTFTKSDIISFRHEQTGSLFGAELPKNSIEFSIDNTDNQWNPFNPSGLGQYLAERQELRLRYGMDIEGTVEWIKGGTFYLSEWRTPSNGFEASFVARDLLEFMLNETYTGIRSGSMYDIAAAAVEQANLPAGASVTLFDFMMLEDGNLGEDEDYTLAEVLQMCAHATANSMYHTRDGALMIWPVAWKLADDHFVIPASLSYTYPEVELSKRLKNVVVTYGDGLTYTLTVNDTGETQTVNNPIMLTASQAETAAIMARDGLVRRQMISGEYRGDPTLDLFDIGEVESKFGTFSPVILTQITYTFTGAFRTEYAGRVLVVEET